MSPSDDLAKELQQTKMLLEVEKQKVRKLEQELERLQKKLSGGLSAGPSLGSLGGGSLKPLAASPARPASPAPAAPSAPAGVEDDGDSEGAIDASAFANDAEVRAIKSQLDKVTKEKSDVEERKWRIDKENINLKEALNKLKVQGQNHQKIIEEQVGKTDRKENQNFKTRLELTDLRKALKIATAEREKQEEHNTLLYREIAEHEAEIRHLAALIDQEQQRRDVIQKELNAVNDVLGQYQSGGILAKFYDK